MKILRNLCLHFARQYGQDEKKQKENHATKGTKIPKTKRQKCGMNKTLGITCDLVSTVFRPILGSFFFQKLEEVLKNFLSFFSTFASRSH